MDSRGRYNVLVSTLLAIGAIAFVSFGVFAARADLIRLKAKARANETLPVGQKVRTSFVGGILAEYERLFPDRTMRTKWRRSAALSGACFALFAVCMVATGTFPGGAILLAPVSLGFSALCLKGFFA
jgi:hypothetical protein